MFVHEIDFLSNTQSLATRAQILVFIIDTAFLGPKRTGCRVRTTEKRIVLILPPLVQLVSLVERLFRAIHHAHGPQAG